MSLRKAQQDIPLVAEQAERTARFIERAKKRLSNADEWVQWAQERRTEWPKSCMKPSCVCKGSVHRSRNDGLPHNRLRSRGQKTPSASGGVEVSGTSVQPSPSIPSCAVVCRSSPVGAGTSFKAKSLWRGSAFAQWLCTKHLELRDALEIGEWWRS